MGTNRRSRRRSAARILNPSLQNKRQKCITEFEDDSNEENFPPLASPDTSDHPPNPDDLHDMDSPDYAPSPMHNGDVTTTITPTSQSNQLCTTSSGCHTFTPAEIWAARSTLMNRLYVC